MPPPPSFIDVTSIPFSRVVTQAEFNGGTFGGVANEVWFRRVVTSREALGGSVDHGGTFTPLQRIYASDGSTLLHTITQPPSSWWFVFAPGTYYIRINKASAGSSDFDFTCNFNTKPLLTSISPGSLVINDDTSGFPATVIFNSQLAGIYEAIPPGEIAAILPTGESLWHDRFGQYDAINKLALFNSNMQYVMSIDTLFGLGGNVPLISHDNSKFYVYDPGDRSIYTVTTVGTVAFSTGPLPIGNKFALGIKRDGNIAYYSKGSFDGILYRWDIPGNAPLSNLYTIGGWVPGADKLAETPNNNPGEILVLSDNTIVTWWRDAAPTPTTHILIFSSSEILIHDFTFTDAVEGLIDHISYGIFDAINTITIWFQDTFLISGFYYTLLLANGNLTTIHFSDMFSAGIDLVDFSTILFGPSESCAMVTYLLGIPPAPPPNPGSGIYKLVSNKRQDTLYNDTLTGTVNVKIP